MPRSLAFMRVHVAPQNGIDARLITVPRSFQPCQNVTIKTECHRGFALRHDQLGGCPKVRVRGFCIGIGVNPCADVRIAHMAQLVPICAMFRHRHVASRFVVHGVLPSTLR